MLSLSVVMFLANLNQLMLWPFYVDVARTLDTSVPLIGQTTTLALLVSAVLGIFIGPLADHFGHRRTLLLAAAGIVISAFGTTLAPSFITLLGARLLSGVSAGVANSVVLAVAGTRFAGETRRRAMSWTIAALAAPAIGGIPIIAGLGDLFGWRWSFALVGMLAVAGCGLLQVALPADPPVSASPFRPRSIMTAYRPFVRHRTMSALLAGSTLRAIAWVGMLTYFGAFWVEEKGLSVSGSGLMLMIGGTGFFCGSLAAGGRLGHFDLRLLFAATTGAAITLLGLLYTLPVGPVALVLPLFAAGFLGAFSLVALTALLASETPAAPATTMALNSAVFSLGSAFGAMAGGGLLAVGGYSMLGSGLTAFGIASALVVWQPGRAARLALVDVNADPSDRTETISARLPVRERP
jgi:MFS transporter, DHA1 family, inner membrane transport protein